jgi:hypothetical protein
MAHLFLSQQLRDELNTAIIKTCGAALKAIRDKSIPDDGEDYILSGILFETIRTANTLLQREQVNIILDVERANFLVFRQHPELRDVVCTACQTGEFGGVVDLGQSLLICWRYQCPFADSQ